MNYYFENHVRTHESPLNSVFILNKPDNIQTNPKHYDSNTHHTIISNVNTIQPITLLYNNNNNNNNKKLHTKPKNCNVETDSDTNTEEDNASFITTKNPIKNNILAILKDKIFSPGDYQEQEDLLLMNNYNNNNNNNNNIDSEFNLSINNSHFINLSTRNPFNVSSLSPMRGISTSHHHHHSYKTLILDLDETLVHSTFHPIYRVPDIQLNIQFNNQNHSVYVFKRPYVDKFLYQMSKIFNIVIFTASIPEYANPLLDRLDIYKVISKRFFRGDCTERNGLYVKELKKVGYKLQDMIILDNNPVSYSLNKENGFPIRTWHYDKTDVELNKIIPYLEYLSTVDDVRCVLSKVNRGGCIDESYFDFLMKQRNNNNKVNKSVFRNKGVNEYAKKESYMNGNNNGKENINMNTNTNTTNNNNNNNQSIKVLHRSKSISSLHQKQNEEHLQRVNRLKEEILNSINSIDPKGNLCSNDINSNDYNNNNSILKSRSNYFSSNNNNNIDTNVKHHHHHLRRTNSSICVMVRPNSLTKNNSNCNSNKMESIVNKPNYINFSHLYNSSCNNNNNTHIHIHNSTSSNQSYCDNKKNSNLQTPIHSYLINNKAFTSSKRRNMFKTPSMISNPSLENGINNSYTKYKYRFAGSLKNN